ncbi:hypothetical protein J7L29_07600 [Candidatus Bathyarchaeota archaeon]|nr:hypothetical protein [Candidatus Bathyarchaeota archaeon]
MFHCSNVELTRLFAEACGTPPMKAETPGEKKKELEDLKSLLMNVNIEGMVFGAISSTYQKHV